MTRREFLRLDCVSRPRFSNSRLQTVTVAWEREIRRSLESHDVDLLFRIVFDSSLWRMGSGPGEGKDRDANLGCGAADGRKIRSERKRVRCEDGGEISAREMAGA